MQVLSNYSSNVYHNDLCCNIAFQSKYRTETFNSHRAINSINRYFQDIFVRAAEASKTFWFSKDKKLESSIQEIYLKSNKGLNPAWDINPDGRKKYLVVIHGLGHNISSLQELYKGIIENTKFGILAPEYTNLTEEKTNTKKLFKTFSPKSMENDFQASIDYLNQKGIEKNDIFVFGHCFGSYPASMMAQKNNDIGGLVLLSPMNSFEYVYENINSGKQRKTPNYIKFLMSHFKIYQKIFRNIYQTEKLLENTNVPVDIIHGNEDNMINIKFAKRLGEKCLNLNSFTILDSKNHFLEAKQIEAVINTLNEK